MRAMNKQRLGMAGAAGLAVVLAATPAGAAVTSMTSVGPLQDLSVATVDPTDGARAVVKSRSTSNGTTVRMALRGLDTEFAGLEYGAHIHVGTCVAGDGAAAGPHYNSTGLPGTPGRVVNDETEVWLDFTVGEKGRALATAKVPFVIPEGGAGALVIHATHTLPDGTAGARLACLPVQF